MQKNTKCGQGNRIKVPCTNMAANFVYIFWNVLSREKNLTLSPLKSSWCHGIMQNCYEKLCHHLGFSISIDSPLDKMTDILLAVASNTLIWMYFKSQRSKHAIWCQAAWSTLVQVMACHLWQYNWHQAIDWTNVHLLSIRLIEKTLKWNYDKNCIKELHFKMLSAICHPFWSDLIVLMV